MRKTSDVAPTDLRRVAVIGGGRWARVVVDVLCGMLPSTVKITVHSLRNAVFMSDWAAKEECRRRIAVSSDWPQFAPAEPSAMIVLNAARDHEKAVDRALSAGVPVLVEKPIALTAAAAQRLADKARERKIFFAPAHVFLFARYLEKFSILVTEAGKVKSLRMHWTDLDGESRHGEKMRFDPGLPMFKDCLPHVLSIAGAVAPGLPRCVGLEMSRDGLKQEIELMLGDVPCGVHLARNSDRRRRIVEVDVGAEVLSLDFSVEPGSISFASKTINGDPDWETEKRPVARMLTAFLHAAAGGEPDPRFNVEIGLRACRVSDQAEALYHQKL